MFNLRLGSWRLSNSSKSESVRYIFALTFTLARHLTLPSLHVVSCMHNHLIRGKKFVLLSLFFRTSFFVLFWWMDWPLLEPSFIIMFNIVVHFSWPLLSTQHCKVEENGEENLSSVSVKTWKCNHDNDETACESISSTVNGKSFRYWSVGLSFQREEFQWSVNIHFESC